MMYVMIDWHILVEYYIRYLCNHWGRLRGFDTRHCCGRCTVQQPAGDPSSWRPSNIIQLAVVLLAPLPPDGSLWRLLERWWSWMQHATCNNGNGSIRIWSGRCVVWIFQWVVTLTASHFLTHTERHRTSTKHEAKHNGNGTISSSTYCRANLRRAPRASCVVQRTNLHGRCWLLTDASVFSAALDVSTRPCRLSGLADGS